MAAIGPQKRLSCPQSFAHRLASGLATRSRGRRIFGGWSLCAKPRLPRGVLGPRQVYRRTPNGGSWPRAVCRSARPLATRCRHSIYAEADIGPRPARDPKGLTLPGLEVWQRDGGTCTICNATDELHFDHVLPFSKGGTSVTAANVQLLCARHNLARSDRIE
jgi:hypothetical protein